MKAWSRLEDFGHLVYTVGDGVKAHTIADLNALSIANAEQAVEIASRDTDALVFIAGGNSGENSPRPVQLHGALTEAERMLLYIRTHVRNAIPVITDCDPEFRERIGLHPSGNTPENSRNAAALVELHPSFQSQISIPAERLHLPRVIGTLRRKLFDRGLLEDAHITGHPIHASFDPESDQEHIRSEEAFRRWEWKARLHHILTGQVLRKEFLSEWLSGRNYRQLMDTSS